ncbi:MAG: hypothetical protein RLY78_2608 [Pseudomonadota bacterium]
MKPGPRPRGTTSIRRRVGLSVLAATLAGGVLTTGVVWLVVRIETHELLDQGLRESAALLAPAMLSATTDTAPPWTVRPHRDGRHLAWQLIDVADGGIRRQSRHAPAGPMLPPARLQTLAPPQTAAAGDAPLVEPGQPSDSSDGRWRVVALPLPLARPAWLLVAHSEAERREVVREAVRPVLLTLLAGAGLLALLCALLVRRELRPLQRLSQDVHDYDPLRPDTAPQPTGRTELQPIAEAVSALGQRLARRIHGERAFGAHAAHALRTPLAGLDTQLALALRELPADQQARVRAARQATQRLIRVSQALLTMLRAGSEPRRQRQPLDDLVALLDPQPAVVLPPGPLLEGDPDLLAAVLLNAHDNARRHGARQLTITITHRAEPGSDTPWQELTLRDDGRGCDAATRARLRAGLAGIEFTDDPAEAAGGAGQTAGQPAGRSSGNPQGHPHDSLSGRHLPPPLDGLGLPLADLVARGHGGRLSLPDDSPADSSDDSPGFTLVLAWPLPAPAPPATADDAPESTR